MISQDQFFELISLVSTEKKQSDPLLDCSMEYLGKIDLKVGQMINEQAFQNRSELKRKLNEAIAEAQLQINLPMLSNRHNLIVLSQDTKVNLDILHTISQYIYMPQEFELALKRIADLKLPVIFYHSRKIEPATVYNLVDNLVSLELDQLCSFLSLGDTQDSSSAIPLVQPNNLAQVCAIPWEFKEEFSKLNLIFMGSVSDTDKTQQQLLSMSQSALVIPSEQVVTSGIGVYPLDIKVYTTDNNQDQVNSYLNRCNSDVMRKGSGPLQIEKLPAKSLLSFLKEKNQSSNNLNLQTQLQCILYSLNLATKKQEEATKQQMALLNRFLVESQSTEPFVRHMVTKNGELQKSLSNKISQHSSDSQVIYNQVNELEMLFNQRGFTLHNQKAPAAGGILAWRELFELGSQSKDTPLLHRSVSARQDSDLIVKHVQRLFIDVLEDKLIDKNAIFKHFNNTNMYSDAYRHSLLKLCQVLNDQQNLDGLAQFITESVPFERRNAQEHFLIGQYLSTHKDKLSSEALQSFEATFYLGESTAIEHLIAPYLALANQGSDDSKLKALASTYHPQAAFTYAGYVRSKDFALYEEYLRIAACQDYEPALKEYADSLFTNLTKKNKKSFSKSEEVKAQQALDIYKNLGSKAEQAEAKQGQLLYMLGRKAESIPFLKQAAAYNAFAAFALGAIYLYGEAGVAKDLELASEYLSQSDLPEATDLQSQVIAELRQQVEDSRDSYNSSSDYSEEEYDDDDDYDYDDDDDYDYDDDDDDDDYDYDDDDDDDDYDYDDDDDDDDDDDEGCFITTATCAEEGKPDDCEELTLFRKYRDEILLPTEMGQKLVQEYYRIAPTIVKCIKQDPESKVIFKGIYNDLIRPAYKLLLEKNYEPARKAYVRCVKGLADRYGIEVKDPNLLEDTPSAQEGKQESKRANNCQSTSFKF